MCHHVLPVQEVVYMTEFIKLFFSGKIARAAIRVSLVVGTLLNVVNQGSQILAGTGISWPHLFLNYLVPYCVASYSAAKNELSNKGGS